MLTLWAIECTAFNVLFLHVGEKDTMKRNVSSSLTIACRIVIACLHSAGTTRAVY